MKVIKKITVVTQQGVRSYELGEKVNGLEIKSIVNLCEEYPDHTEVGYRAISDYRTCATDNTVVQFWNIPAVVEYCEAMDFE